MGGEAGAGTADALRDRRRRRGAVVATLVLAVAAFGAVAFTSAAGSVQPIVAGDGGWHLDPPRARTPLIDPNDQETDEEPEGLDSSVTGGVVAGFAQFALLAAAIGLIVLLVRRTVRFVTRIRLEPRLDDDQWEPVPSDPRHELDAAVESGLRRIHAGGPIRDVIIECWVALEDAAGRAGVERDPSETASELTVRVLGALAVPEDAVRRLLGHYRDARYSDHELGDDARADAVAALDEIRRAIGIVARR